jgi:hypothetical protein
MELCERLIAMDRRRTARNLDRAITNLNALSRELRDGSLLDAPYVARLNATIVELEDLRRELHRAQSSTDE